MKDYLMKNARVIGLGVAELVIGILLIINPSAFSTLVVKTVGVGLVGLGIYKGIMYFRTEPLLAEKGNDLFIGLIYLSAGIFAIADTSWFSTTFPLFTVIYGIFIFVLGLLKVQITADHIRQKKPNPIVKGVIAIVTLLISIVIIINPFTYMETTWTFCAAMFIILGSFDLIGLVLEQKDLTIKRPEKKEKVPEKIETERVMEAQPEVRPKPVIMPEPEEEPAPQKPEPVQWVSADEPIESDEDKIV